nr:transposase [Bathymodiolus japonicus methanotrophic gill symbiont]
MSCLNSTGVSLANTCRGLCTYYTNSGNIIEQDHRFIKKITKPMMGFKAFHSAQATIDGIETAHIIRKGQLSEENIPAYKQFMALAG